MPEPTPAFVADISGGATPKLSLENWLYEETGGGVQSGPFKGMKMLRELAWGDGALCPMLLGCHEQELWTSIEEEITRLSAMEAPLVLNVGCAEGYYAVGLKRRLPRARVWATDTDVNALRITRKAALANAVELIVDADPRPALTEGPDLIVIDCEGAELFYLNPYTFPAALKSHIIMEIHQADEERSTADIIIGHWYKTHEIYLVWEGGRNPNEYELLRHKSSILRWLYVCENRPGQMAWLVMRPK